MIKTLFSSELRGVTLLIIVFGLLLFFVDELVENLISSLLGFNFYYQEEVFLKLVYLLIGVATIALIYSLRKNEEATTEEVRKYASQMVLSMIISFFIGLAIHIYFVYTAMINTGSLASLEDNILIYFLPNIMLVVGFVIGGWPMRKINARKYS